MSKFFTRFAPPPSPYIEFCSECPESQSKTHGEFASECDINEIVRRFKVTGVLTDPSHPAVRKPMFGDFSDVPGEDERLRIFSAAEQAWKDLPADERAKWSGPFEILEALAKNKRTDDLRALGLLPPINSQPAEAGTPEPQKSGKGDVGAVEDA